MTETFKHWLYEKNCLLTLLTVLAAVGSTWVMEFFRKIISYVIIALSLVKTYTDLLLESISFFTNNYDNNLEKNTLQKRALRWIEYLLYMILLWRENNIQSISKQNEGGRRRNETPHPVVKKHQRKKLRGEYDYFSDPLFTS